MIFEHQIFSALWLIIKLSCQLHVLNYRKFCGALQLVLICYWVFHAHLTDLHKHVFPQFIDLLNPITLYAINKRCVHRFLIIDLVFPLLKTLLFNTFICLKLFKVSLFSHQLSDSLIFLSFFWFEFIANSLNHILYLPNQQSLLAIYV